MLNKRLDLEWKRATGDGTQPLTAALDDAAVAIAATSVVRAVS